jgi:hypothetical protein
MNPTPQAAPPMICASSAPRGSSPPSPRHPWSFEELRRWTHQAVAQPSRDPAPSAGARACRRKVLLGYFGEEDATDRCGNCDRCLGADDPVLREVGRIPRSRRAAGIFAALLGRSGLG